MRVPDAMQSRYIRQTLGRTTERLLKYQMEVASGLRINRPSDDPAGAMRAATLRTGLSKIGEYQKTAGDALAWLKSEDVALGNIQDTLRQVRDLALQGNTPMTPEARQVIVQQIRDAATSVMQSANGTDGMRYLFGGYHTNAAPFAGTPPDAVTYNGDSGVRRIAIGDGVVLELNHAGNTLLNLDGAANPALPDVFQAINDLADAVSAQDQDAVTAALDVLDQLTTHVGTLRAETGLSMDRAELALDQLGQSELTVANLLAETESADLAEATVHLKEQENILQAATYVASTLGRMGLLNWMR